MEALWLPTRRGTAAGPAYLHCRGRCPGLCGRRYSWKQLFLFLREAVGAAETAVRLQLVVQEVAAVLVPGTLRTLGLSALMMR